ncbi:MAG: DUF1553 domain-containing protein [Armatimonadota bacterium]
MRAGVWTLFSISLVLPAAAALNAPAARPKKPAPARVKPAAKPAAAKPTTAKPAAPAPEAGTADPKALEFFEKKVRPLLSTQCAGCHTGAKAKGKLEFNTRAALLKGGNLGPAVVPGDPDKSLLIQVIRFTGDLKMPPQGKLKPHEIADLEEWVRIGAPWPGQTPAAGSAKERESHWSFQPMKDPAVPKVKNAAWVHSPIDAFILAKLEAKGLAPAPKADKRTLIRRVTFDLTGLPPTPAEIDAFLADTSPQALAKVVDRLLASPAYGERWGRHWLDVARYADSNGLDENTAFGNAWRYRDYVVRSFNADKPYNQFVKEQLAGDLLPASNDQQTVDQLTATGFLVLGPKVLAEPDKGKMVMDIVDEQIDTVGKAFMGLTLGCARCHDHKFDPLPTKDYYALAGIFKSTRTMETLNTVARALERPIPDAEAEAQRKEHQQKVAARREELRKATLQADAEVSRRVVDALPRYLLAGLQAKLETGGAVTDAELARPGAVVLEAEKFTRGDVQVSTSGYGEGIGIIESAGRSEAFTEYEVQIAQAGRYSLAVRYASGEARPVQLSIDGKAVADRALNGATGGFNPPNQRWERIAAVELAAGKHLLRMDQRSASLPHLDKLALLPEVADAAPVPGARPRTLSPAELAKSHSLDAALLRRSAAYLDAARQQPGASIWEPWNQLAALPEDRFAAEAERLVNEWKASGKLMTWSPALAGAFSSAPKSLAETAERYRELFRQANDAWIRLLAEKPDAKKLEHPGLEPFRAALYEEQGAFGLAKAERLYAGASAETVKKLKAEVEELQKQAPPMPVVLAVEEAKEIANCQVHLRGNHLTLGDEVPRRFPVILAGEKQEPVPAGRSGRLELAEWLTEPDHPLTARVMVNRIWQHHFGEGIVRTPDNFGLLGEKPTHPELLDWLAKRFVEKGWSVKAMHRLMILSNAYQMSTAHHAKAALADPENRLFWRFNRRRLEVEAIRDSMLALSGRLERTMGGTLLRTKNFDYVTNDQSGNGAQYDAPRRSLYLPVIRNAVFDVFQIFDFVEPSFLNGKRVSTTVAPQALFLLNGQFVLDQSKALAERMLKLPGDDGARVRTLYLEAFGRPAAAEEVTAAQQYLKAYADRLADEEKDPEARRQRAWQSLCQVVFAASEFIYVN